MAHIKTILVSGAVALVVAVLVGLTLGGSETVREVVKLGGTSPDVISPYLRWGGVPIYQAKQDTASASNVVCALQSPAATSSLLHASVNLDVSSTTASVVTIAKAASATATTTLLTSASVSANAKAYVQVATSTAGGTSDIIFAPNQYLTVGMKGGSGTFSPTGSCQATWISY